MKNQNISIVGGAGFIGSELSSILEKQSSVNFFIVDKSDSSRFPSKVIHGNVLDKDAMIKAHKDCNVIINLAAEHADNVSPETLYYDVNVDGAKNICFAAEANNVSKIVFTSSVAVYGLDKPNPNEEFGTDPFNHYGKSKLQAEEVYLAWQQKDPENRSLVIVRPTVVFGEGNRGNVYNLLRQIATGRFLKIGSGRNLKSMAYVQNVASFLGHNALHSTKGSQTFNYVDKPDLSMNQLLEVCEMSMEKKVPSWGVPYFLGLSGGYLLDFLARVTGKKFTVSSVRIKKFCATTQFDASKMLSAGFEPPFSLKEGLDRTLKAEFRS